MYHNYRIMNLKWFIFMFLMSIGSQSRGDFFDIDTEFNIHRIANTFIWFCTDYYEYLQNYKASGFKRDENFKKLVQELSTSGCILVRLYTKDKKRFRNDFLTLKKYINRNSDTLKTQLGDKKYQVFHLGVYYLQQILLNVR